ncbi:MAG: PD40 domain-containing protein [Lewinellaceae bacterium]|nr:PD40 domain-containing protein [Phaeodactylibacter sp.]MCB9040972.1 PD40 domain-containing protein [Lewinellaceae bacterium]
MSTRTITCLWLAALFAACQPSGADKQAGEKSNEETEAAADTLRYPQETHLKNVRQLTFGGDNAEAYWSFNGQYLSFQATNESWGAECDQIYYMPASGFTGDKPPLVSTGKGRTTCAYFLPGDEAILYASTHLASEACPEVPRSVQGKYVWPVYADFDIFVADLDGNVTKQLTDSPGYDAEATLSPDGQKIVFTSTRSGDLELWTMDIDGSNPRQVTNELGYDGGAFFSPDSKKLVFRASRPKTEEEVNLYKSLLAENVVQPTDMEVFVCNVDGSEMQQVTNLGKANWAPYFHPSGERILFASNHHTGSGRQFNIFSVKLDGTGLQQITFDETFDAFPMFSPDGKKIAFSSNRNNGGTRNTNVFVADWVE